MYGSRQVRDGLREYGGPACYVRRMHVMGDVDDAYGRCDARDDTVQGGGEPAVKPVVSGEADPAVPVARIPIDHHKRDGIATRGYSPCRLRALPEGGVEE